ncbi:hypothetical protein K505DRAFT_365307 [Melanomma pulvis-pyrius CBS 109.77]|uniref:BTB domain-containing protein n=1 Tax=Melanomma pulvis-pyrius CBS 109.77 TaxID=1314802 RepID=A0A6A6X099_9PLEO|nr:hypothetical protein K505DRAFT_365307 [Melanomma pulvis-pyrius CBS 109.77]
MTDSILEISLLVEFGKLKFSQSLTSSTVAITVAKSRTFYLHSNLLTAESERFSKSLSGKFKEAEENAIHLEDEDPNLFGFFVEYLYRNRPCEVKHNSAYVTLARLYALGERIMAPNFQSHCLWRFTQSLGTNSDISGESICELLRIACTEITERPKEDPMRVHIFWYGPKSPTSRNSTCFISSWEIFRTWESSCAYG